MTMFKTLIQKPSKTTSCTVGVDDRCKIGVTAWLIPTFCLSVCATALLAGCAAIDSRPPEVRVAQRANERWQALIKKDFNQAYAFSTTGYKALVNPEDFRTKTTSAAIWTAASVSSVKCSEASKCVARLRIDFKAILGGKGLDGLNTYINENWILEDGEWRIVLDI